MALPENKIRYLHALLLKYKGDISFVQINKIPRVYIRLQTPTKVIGSEYEWFQEDIEKLNKTFEIVLDDIYTVDHRVTIKTYKLGITKEDFDTFITQTQCFVGPSKGNRDHTYAAINQLPIIVYHPVNSRTFNCPVPEAALAIMDKLCPKYKVRFSHVDKETFYMEIPLIEATDQEYFKLLADLSVGLNRVGEVFTLGNIDLVRRKGLTAGVWLTCRKEYYSEAVDYYVNKRIDEIKSAGE